MKGIFGSTIRQARSHQNYWQQRRPGELPYVALGDSTGLGVGVPDPLQGYVGILSTRLMRATGKSINTINLSISGERAKDLLDRQIPWFNALESTPLVTCAVGANNVAFSSPRRPFDAAGFATTMEKILQALPQHAMIATVPSFGVPPWENWVRTVNEEIKRLVSERGQTLVDLYAVTKPLWPLKYLFGYTSRDFFHPNARGYKLWADAFWGPMQARLEHLDDADPRH